MIEKSDYNDKVKRIYLFKTVKGDKTVKVKINVLQEKKEYFLYLF